MEDQPQKMEALKKAYAEIILNTAKEAAARAMASERKALRFHHDLRNTKDEALQMLLRFKQMIDVKTTEAETTTSNQQKRIEELDAQLNEAEGVIVDLRAQISKAHERLEELKNSHMVQSNGPSENEHMHQENTADDKKLDVTEQLRCSSQCGRSCNPAKETTTSGPNLSSIIMGSKEPEFYRNGYTHRIRAIERNLADENNILEDKPADDICTKMESIINVDEKNSGNCAPSSIDSEKKDTKNINRSKAFSINNRVVKDQLIKTRRLPNSGRYAQSKHRLSRFCNGSSIKPNKEPEKLILKENSCGKDAELTDNNEKSVCTLRRSIRKRKVRCWEDISSLFKSRGPLSHCKKCSGNDSVKLEEHQYRSKSVAGMNQMIGPISPSTDTSKESKYDELPEARRINAVEDTKLLNNSVVEKHGKAAKESAVVACDTDNNRLLKYTFSRRRKKVLSSKSDNCSSLGENSFASQMGEKPSFFPENKKPSLVEDSFSDSQNMIDVACQLISLSGESNWRESVQCFKMPPASKGERLV